MFLTPTSPEEINKEIMKLNSKKAAGPDEISPKIIKDTANQITQPLNMIFNDSFDKSVYPQLFKIAKVIPYIKN